MVLKFLFQETYSKQTESDELITNGLHRAIEGSQPHGLGLTL